MKDHPGKSEQTACSGESADGRRPYSPPALKRRDKLPVITAGSISESQWQFSGDTQYEET